MVLYIVFLIITIGLIFFIFYLLKERSDLKSYEVKSKLQEEQLSVSQKEIILLREELNKMSLSCTELQTKLLRSEADLSQAKEEYKAINDEMIIKFRDIASSVIDSKTQHFKEESQSILDPFKNELKSFREKVEQVYDSETRDRASLQTLIKTLSDQSNKVSEEANNLANALKGNSKIQGDWGEMILTNILENSGLRRNEEFLLQPTLKDIGHNILEDDNDGWEKLRPDAILKYPDNKYVVIDSKVSLSSFTDMVASEDEKIKEAYLKKHIMSIRNHINELKNKSYEKYLKDSPRFVLMFIPSDYAYTVALSKEPNLWHDAYKQKIILINGTNLVTALMMIKDMWIRDKQIKNVAEIVERAGKIYDKFAGYINTFNNIGDKLKDAQTAYDKAKGQLFEGQGNLCRQFENLKVLGIQSAKKIEIK